MESRPTHISNAVHPDSYRDRGQFYFYCPKDSPKESFVTFGADYYENPAVTEVGVRREIGI
jgi:hypothetical protein